jgi:hypothetical protein
VLGGIRGFRKEHRLTRHIADTEVVRELSPRLDVVAEQR